MIATSFFIGSSLNLQIIKADINSQTGSILAEYRLLVELPALEDLIDFGKYPYDSNFIFDRIFIRLAGKEDSNTILDEFHFWADRTIHIRVT